MLPYRYQKLEPRASVPINEKTSGIPWLPVRLLDLAPGPNDGDIRCKLRHANLGSNPEYEALSYTWGSPVRSHQILCEELRINVTDTLEQALRALRYPDRIRTLWIDQLCINQDDVEERNSQVEIMHLVYKRANRTIVFLACGRNVTELTINLNRSGLLKELRKAHMAGEGPMMKTFQELFSHPWFQRAWVLQEVAMSKDILFYYRGSRLSWRALWGASWLLRGYTPGHTYKRVEIPFSVSMHRRIMSGWTSMGGEHFQTNALLQYRQSRKRYPSFLSFLSRIFLLSVGPRLNEALQNSRYCQATDARDRIYSLLNLCRLSIESEEVQWLIDIDYSLSIAEIYTRAARSSILKENSLEILGYKEHGSKIPGLPSWVPDWTQQTLFPISHITLPVYYRSQFHGGAWPTKDLDGRLSLPPLYYTRNQACDARFSSGGEIVFVNGCVIDVVTTLGPIWKSDLLDPNKTTFDEWMRLYFSSTKRSSSDKESESSDTPPLPSFKPETKSIGVKIVKYSLHDFWLRIGRYSHAHPQTPSPTSVNRFFHRRHLIPRGFFQIWNNTMYSLWFRDWLSLMVPYAFVGRRVARTQDGLFALVPPDTQAGDIVCWFKAAGSVPFILRKAEGTETWYRLVGPCYAHGVYPREGLWKNEHCCARFEIR